MLRSACLAEPLEARRLLASITPFFNKTAFLAATQATSETGAIPLVGRIAAGTYTAGTITFTTAANALYLGVLPSDGVPNNDFSQKFPGDEIGITGTEDLDVQASTPRYSSGLDFIKPINDCAGLGSFIGGGTPSTFEVTLRDASGGTVGSFTFTGEYCDNAVRPRSFARSRVDDAGICPSSRKAVPREPPDQLVWLPCVGGYQGETEEV